MFSKIKYILFLFVILCLNGCFLYHSNPHYLYLRALKQQPYDAIIVPGIPFDGSDWNRIMKERVLWASFLLKKGVAKNVIFSGGAVYSPYIEGKVMALYAEQLGIPKENIFIEDKAEHSIENVYYSYILAQKMGFSKIAIASDPYQTTFLIKLIKRKFDFPISHIPYIRDTILQMNVATPCIPADSALKKDFKSILETQSKWYRFTGTYGFRIKIEKNNYPVSSSN